LTLDVTSKSSIDAAVAAAVEKFGRLDVVVNNAGYTLSGDTENATDEQERQEIETLFWGPVRISKHAMRVMRDENPKTGQQGGVVLNVTSLGGFVGWPGAAFYHAGKFALEGFTESVAKEMRPEWNSKRLPYSLLSVRENADTKGQSTFASSSPAAYRLTTQPPARLTLRRIRPTPLPTRPAAFWPRTDRTPRPGRNGRGRRR